MPKFFKVESNHFGSPITLYYIAFESGITQHIGTTKKGGVWSWSDKPYTGRGSWGEEISQKELLATIARPLGGDQPHLPLHPTADDLTGGMPIQGRGM